MTVSLPRALLFDGNGLEKEWKSQTIQAHKRLIKRAEAIIANTYLAGTNERRITPKALDKFKTRIRDMTGRTRGIRLGQLIEELTPYLIGWRGYFGFCQTPLVLASLEAWIRQRLRAYPWRQWRNGYNRFKELRRRGVPKFKAAVAAGSPTGLWRMSGHPAVQMALRNHDFDSLGLPRLHVPAQA